MIKKIIGCVVFVVLFVVINMGLDYIFNPFESYAMVKNVTSSNYKTYEKIYSDEYGCNKGECKKKYLIGEEYFYNDYYDHWNVDLIYDYSLLNNKKIAKEYCKVNYPKCKVKFVKMFDKRIDKRKGKKIVYVEKMVSRSKGKYGYTIKGHYYIRYNRKVKKGKKVISYCIWNPYTNYIDDVVAVVDNKQIR